MVDLVTSLSENSEYSDEIKENIESLIPVINETRDSIEKLYITGKETTEEAKKLLDEVSEGVNSVSQNDQKLKEQLDKDDKVQKMIEQTLSDVNKHGMAGAFLKRKEELKKTVILWGVLSLISMSGLVIVSYLLANELISNPNFDPLRNLFKIPSVIAGVWLCWFCAKQYGFTIRIREDYSFKYAISMAFEGYKKETREVNPDLLEKLVQLTIISVSLNPESIYDTKSNHGSPMNETFSAIQKIFKLDLKGKVDMSAKDLLS